MLTNSPSGIDVIFSVPLNVSANILDAGAPEILSNRPSPIPVRLAQPRKVLLNIAFAGAPEKFLNKSPGISPSNSAQPPKVL